MTTRQKTELALGCVSAFLGIGSWFAPTPLAAVLLAIPAVLLGVWVLYRTRPRRGGVS